MSTALERQQWVLEVVPTIKELARGFASKWRSISCEEFESAGNVAAVEGALRFYVGMARTFEAYIFKRLRGAMLDLVRTRLGQVAREDLFCVLVEVRDAVEGEPDEEAEEIVVDPSAPSAWEGALLVATRKATMLAAAWVHSAEDALLDAAAYRAGLERLHNAGLALEDPRERTFYIRFYEEERGLDEVAAELGVSKRTASRIHDAVKDALTEAMRHAG